MQLLDAARSLPALPSETTIEAPEFPDNPRVMRILEQSHPDPLGELRPEDGEIDFGRTRDTQDDQIEIASWNIKHFSARKSRREIEVMAEVVAKYDIVGIQEVLDERGPEELVDALGKLRGEDGKKLEYDVIVTEKRGRTPNEAERYAFVYDTETIEVLNTGRWGEFDDESDDSTDESEHPADIARLPYAAAFSAKGRPADRPFDFVLILVHTKPPSGTRLARELDIIGQVYADMPNYFPDEFDFILMGDFNERSEYTHFGTHLMRPFRLQALIPHPTSTMIDGQGTKTNDNILLPPETMPNYVEGSAGVDDFDTDLVPPPRPSRVSDHRLIYGSFERYGDRD